MKASIALPLGLGALPLLVYPFVALASLMSLAAPANDHQSLLLLAAARGFQVTSLGYPLVYFGCLASAIVLKKRQQPEMAFRVSLAPLCYFGVVCLLLGLWYLVEQTGQ